MEFKDILDKRRAINFFDPETDVDEAVLQKVFADAVRAPSSFNLQPWSLIVLRDKAEKETLRELAWDQPKVSEAPVTLIVLGDREGWKEGNETFEKVFSEAVAAGNMEAEQREWFVGATSSLYGSDEMTSQAFANKNAGLFAMSLMYAASCHGLQTHPMDGFDHDGVKKAFNIPDRFWVPMIIAVGYMKPGLELHPQRWRKGVDDLVVSFK